MARFVEVAKGAEVPPGTATVVQLGGTELALVNVDGTFFAVDNECTHMGGFLGRGRDQRRLERVGNRVPGARQRFRRPDWGGAQSTRAKACGNIPSGSRRRGSQGLDRVNQGRRGAPSAAVHAAL